MATSEEQLIAAGISAEKARGLVETTKKMLGRNADEIEEAVRLTVDGLANMDRIEQKHKQIEKLFLLCVKRGG